MNTKRQVLVIDDDAVVGRSFDRVLSGKGYDVSTALSGEEAMKDIESTDYDGTEENEARASVLGVNGFVRKPLTPAMIESITLKALQEPHAEQLAEPQAANEPEAPVEIVEEAKTSTLRTAGRIAKNIGLFFAAPFIALAYVIALPAVGFYMFAKLGIEAYQKKKSSS